MQIDKIVGPLNHKHKEKDIVGLVGKYVEKAGGTMTGDLVFPVTGFIITDSNTTQWRVTVETTGNLTTTEIIVTDPGFPYGSLLLSTLIS